MAYVRIKITRAQPKRRAITRSFLFSDVDAAIVALNNMAVAAVLPETAINHLIDDLRQGLEVSTSSDGEYTFDLTVADQLETLQDPFATFEDEPDPIMHYVLMRKDVPDYLSGKAQAQANHAGTKMVIEGYRKNDADLTALIDEWEQEGGGFGTCIVLEVDAPTMRQAVSMAELLDLHCGIVHDPSYPLRDGDKLAFLPVDTCAYIFGRKSSCFPVVGKFPLLRDEYRQ